MTVTTNIREHDLTPLFRTEIKRNGIVIRIIHSESGHDYHVTLFEGNVTSCEQAPRYYPAYKLQGTWYRYQQAGKDVSFTTEQEALEYLTGVLFETRVETESEPCPSWRYRHSCHHATLARQLEAEYQEAYEGCEHCGMNHKSWNCPF